MTETTTDFSAYARDIGLYRAILNDEIVYVGKATELNNGGFRKRLRDYTRTSSSARNFPAGKLMHFHRVSIQMEILVFQRNLESIPCITAEEARLIYELKPIWNSQT